MNQICLNFSSWGGWNVMTAIASVLMAGSALLAVVSYFASRKSHYLSTIESCSREYRIYMRLLQLGKFNQITKYDLLGLFHKQLFYIRNNYVPKKIKIEWLKTMTNVLRNNNLATKLNAIQENEALHKGKTIHVTFTEDDWTTSFDRVQQFYNCSLDEERKPKKKKDIIRSYRRRYFKWPGRLFLFLDTDWQDLRVLIKESLD